MNKNVSILMLCIILLLYGCNSDKFDSKLKTQPETTLKHTKDPDNPIKSLTNPPLIKNYETSTDPMKSPTNTAITLTDKEKRNLDILRYAFDIIIRKQQSLNKNDTLDTIETKEDAQKLETKYNTFWTWISDNAQIQKLKELSNSFSKIYNFIEEKRNKLASNKNIKEYIQGALYFYQDDEYNNTHTFDIKIYSDSQENYIANFFEYVLTATIIEYDTNEEIFQSIKKEFQDKNSESYQNTLAQWTQ
ncbi:Mlp family lipoprotein [Borrelia hispanica]|uniref:Mlp family lipoprotein n=1 Tax=Borrelia hispanica TaxID=40835 RepID=UPI000467419C|nr:Mlp family lipoprotein [Borrelia hispanica]